MGFPECFVVHLCVCVCVCETPEENTFIQLTAWTTGQSSPAKCQWCLVMPAGIHYQIQKYYLIAKHTFEMIMIFKMVCVYVCVCVCVCVGGGGGGPSDSIPIQIMPKKNAKSSFGVQTKSLPALRIWLSTLRTLGRLNLSLLLSFSVLSECPEDCFHYDEYEYWKSVKPRP